MRRSTQYMRGKRGLKSLVEAQTERTETSNVVTKTDNNKCGVELGQHGGGRGSWVSAISDYTAQSWREFRCVGFAFDRTALSYDFGESVFAVNKPFCGLLS